MSKFIVKTRLDGVKLENGQFSWREEIVSMKASPWIGSRRMVTINEFDPEIDPALREYRGPGIYKSTGERVAPLHGLDFKKQGEIFDHGPRHWVRDEEDYEKIWEDGKS